MKQNRWLPALTILIVSIFLVLPLLILGIYSFVTSWDGIAPNGYTLDFYKQVFSDPRFFPSLMRGLVISIVPIFLSGAAVILALYTSIMYNPRLESIIQSICMIPHTLKGVILAISVLGLYAGKGPVLGNRIVMLTFVYCIVILPFIYQGIRNNLRAINVQQLIEAAEILGAGKLYAFVRIIIPNMLSGILISSLLAMSTIFTDFAIIKIVAGSKWLTAQQLLYNARNNPGQYTSAIVLIMFLATLLISGVAFAMQNRADRRAEQDSKAAKE